MRFAACLLLALSCGCACGAGSGASTGGQSAGGDPADAGPPAQDGRLPLRQSPTAAENQLSGSREWRLEAHSTQIAAYANRTSALAGETVNIHAGAAAATTASWQLWRLGYYGGALGRKLAEGGPVAVPLWTPAKLDAATGAVSAGWPATFAIQVPEQALTGVYLVKISSSLGQTYATFVVREPSPAAVILYSVSTNTYQAYNNWGGTSFYENSRSEWPKWHAFAVSFDRPYNRNRGTGDLLDKDRDFITFAEAQGYDIAYVTDADLDADPGLVSRRRMLLFQGHSEYWTAAMYDATEKAIASGTNVAFLAANSAYWQVRFADASRRLLIGYKEFAALDPANASDPAHVTARWRDAPLNRPENHMIGEMYGAWMWVASPLFVRDPASWIWTGAEVSANTMIPGVYAEEVDNRGDRHNLPSKLAVVCGSTTEDHNGDLAAGETTLYPAASGAQVFSTGSIKWSRALSVPGQWDARVQQATANVFSVLAGDGKLPASLPAMGLALPRPPVFRTGVQVSTVTRDLREPRALAVAPNGDAIVVDEQRIVRITPSGAVTSIAGGRKGFADGPADSAQFFDPRGIAAGPDGTIYLADTRNYRIRTISGGIVQTLAGSKPGFADGVGSVAQFASPTAVAMTSKGTLLVADTGNRRIRAVARDGTVTTWAGTGKLGLQDGPGNTATLYHPMFIAPVPGGDALFVEPESGVLRRISAAPPHTISTVAGSIGAVGWSDGPAGDVRISEIIAAAVRPDGEVVMIDGASARVRGLRNGAVDTIAGGLKGSNADGAGPDAAFSFPRSVAIAPDGSILVIDVAEHALRRIKIAP